MRLRDERALARILGILEEPGWEDLTQAALDKLKKNEDSITRVLFRTRTELDEREIEYYRGFRQGVMYILQGLPHQLRAEMERALKGSEQ